jgi:hypothetical protein
MILEKCEISLSIASKKKQLLQVEEVEWVLKKEKMESERDQ